MNSKDYQISDYCKDKRKSYLCLAGLDAFCAWLSVTTERLLLTAKRKNRLKPATPGGTNFMKRGLNLAD